jgi:flavin prenyltransferase
VEAPGNEAVSRVIVGISGASGAIYGLRTVETLRDIGCETHVVVTDAGIKTLYMELGVGVAELREMATCVYDNEDIGACVASGSMRIRGMIVAPCTVRSLSAIAHCQCDTLLVRAADVTLKEGRPLVLMVRETPLHKGHLELMLRCADYGAVIFPPVPSFYSQPKDLREMVDQTVARVIEKLGLTSHSLREWEPK